MPNSTNRFAKRDLVECGCFILLLVSTLLTRVETPYTHYAVHDYLIPFFVLVLLSARMNTLKDAFAYHRRSMMFLGSLYLWMWCSAFLSGDQHTAVKFTLKYSYYLLVFIMFMVFLFHNRKVALYHRVIFYFLLSLSFFGVLDRLSPGLNIFLIVRAGIPSGSRISSLMQNPNPFGVLMAFGTVLSVILFKNKIISLKELCAGIILFPITAILSGSRNAILTLAAGAIFLIVSGETRRKKLLMYGSIGVLLLFALMYFAESFCPFRNLSVAECRYYRLDGIMIRWMLWKQAIVIFAHHPVAGAGAGVFRADVAGKMFPGWGFNAHNALLNIAAEFGFVGVALSGAFLFAILKKTDFKDSLAFIPLVMFIAASLFDFFDFEITFVVISLYFLAFAANSRINEHI